NGRKNTFKEEFADTATNAIFVRSGRTTIANEGYQAGRQTQFKNEDYEYIKDEFKDKIEFITSVVMRNANASYRNEKNSYNLIGVYPDYQFVEKNEIIEGRYINKNDLDNETKVIVIGRLVEEDLFINESAIGKYRSEEHTSELQSRENLVCRLLLEKKKPIKILAHIEQTT